MTKIIELAHLLGDEIAKSNEIKILNEKKEAFDSNGELQKKMREYETDRLLLGQEFAKEDGERDEIAVANLRARMEELTREISISPVVTSASRSPEQLMPLTSISPVVTSIFTLSKLKPEEISTSPVVFSIIRDLKDASGRYTVTSEVPKSNSFWCHFLESSASIFKQPFST